MLKPKEKEGSSMFHSQKFRVSVGMVIWYGYNNGAAGIQWCSVNNHPIVFSNKIAHAYIQVLGLEYNYPNVLPFTAGGVALYSWCTQCIESHKRVIKDGMDVS